MLRICDSVGRAPEYSGQCSSLWSSILAGQDLATPWRLATHWIVSPHLGVSGEKAVDRVCPQLPPPPQILVEPAAGKHT